MKKFTQILALFVLSISLLVLQSCNESEKIEPAPIVDVDPTAAANTPGKIVSANVTVSAPNGGKSLVIYVAGVEAETKDISTLDLSVPIPYEYTIPSTAIIGSVIVVSFQAIDNKDYPSAISNFIISVGDPIVKLEGILATQTLDASIAYLLKGQVFVPNGVTLTIPEGTVIKGDKATKAALIIQPGGKLIANGTAAKPIVFTSSQAIGERDRGDWGGVILLGNAWVNQSAMPAIEGITPSQTYGNITSPTTNADENSGSLKYVRIEYAGVELTPNNETNSLTLGAVGSGTTLDFVQVSFGGDDGFEWFGGSVNAKHLISLSTWDDDFDTDFGWSGNVQWGLSVRNPFFADQSGSTAFESDNQGNANDIPSGLAGYTKGVFSNVSVFGPLDFNTGLGSGTSARSISGNYTRAMHIRRRTALSLFNSVISGWSLGLTMDDQATLDNFTSGAAVLSNNVLFAPNTTANGEFGSNVSGAASTTVKDFWINGGSIVEKPTASGANGGWSPTPESPATSVNPYAAYGLDKELFFGAYTASTYPSNPNFAISSGSLTGQTAATLFANAKLGSFFDKTLTYKGAFGATDWTDGWAEFQPQATAY
ncbi:MAG: hypothetical protein JJE09_02520 [Bacteroidia bacterium]|nr:hypothetical protein [Bacteroidia bacterium]